MPNLARIKLPSPVRLAISSISGKPALMVLSVLILAPLAAHAQGSPFDTGFNAIQGLFTGTIAKVASLVAIVTGGYGFAHGEPGAKKALAGVAAGTGIASLTLLARRIMSSRFYQLNSRNHGRRARSQM